ncbi:MAG: AAA family ATPase [Burkholderiales bacterium]|nr:AAA family ATPase [Burkholderiales bacterium]
MYETFFGLTGKPFQLNPDPSFFYASRGHKRAYAYLEYGLYQSEGFIVITGEVGAGKTTIVRGLLEQLDPAKVAAAHLVSTQLDADDLLRSIAVAFGLPAKAMDKALLLASLEAFFCKCATEGKRALLVVDEAQNLTERAVEELRMLSNFQLGDRALVQSFLVGQPQLRDMMRSPQMQQLRQRVIASYHLGPIDKTETGAYVEHRLTRVGWKDDPHIDPECYDAIHALTGGIPRRMNTLCNRLLLAAFLSEQHAIGEKDVRAIARELSDEIDPDSAIAPLPTSLVSEGRLATPMTGAALHKRLDHLEEQIDRLDRTVAAAVELLHRLFHPDRSQKPGAPGGR